MKPFYLPQKVDAEHFRQAFLKHIPTDSVELDYEQVCGTINNGSFSFYVKLYPRGFRFCISEYLRAKIEADGRIYCQFKRTLPAFLFQIIAPIFILAISILMLIFNETDAIGACLPLAIVFSLFNCFKSKSLRWQLRDAVTQIATEAQSN